MNSCPVKAKLEGGVARRLPAILHSPFLILTCCVLALLPLSCGRSPKSLVLATVGERQITIDDLKKEIEEALLAAYADKAGLDPERNLIAVDLAKSAVDFGRSVLMLTNRKAAVADLTARLRALGAVSVRTLDGIQETIKFPLPKGLKAQA